jgi:hypothetical protein
MLTRRQCELLLYIDRHLKQTGFSPSSEEMKDALKLKSKSSIHRLILALEERGFLGRRRYRARALEVLRLPGNLAARSNDDPTARGNHSAVLAEEQPQCRRFKTKFQNDDEWEAYAADLINSPDVDLLVRALDDFGWMIVPQDSDDDRRWCMNEPSSNCPSWADNEPRPIPPGTTFSLSEPRPGHARRILIHPPPPLQVIDGDKKDDA